MDKAKWDAIVELETKAINEQVKDGPNEYVRETWRAPDKVYGHDAAYDVTTQRLYRAIQRREALKSHAVN